MKKTAEKQSLLKKFFLNEKGKKVFAQKVLKREGQRTKGYKSFMSKLDVLTQRKTERINKFDSLDTFFRMNTPKANCIYDFSDDSFCNGVSPLAVRYLNSKILSAYNLKVKGIKKAPKLDGSGDSKKFATVALVPVK